MKTTTILKKGTALIIGLFLSGSMTSAQVLDPSSDPHIESHVRILLKKLNSGGGKPVEQLSPAAARSTLTDAQSSVKVDLAGIKISQKTISESGLSVNITIVKPEKATGILPVFMFFSWRWLGPWRLSDA